MIPGMNSRLSRRHLLAGPAALATLVPARGFAQLEAGLARGFVNGADFGLVSNSGAEGDDPDAYDQTARLQQAVDAAANAGLPLYLPGGIYAAGPVELPSSITIHGVRGATRLLAIGDAPILRANQKSAITLRDLSFDGVGTGASEDGPGLLTFIGCENVELDALRLQGGSGNGLHLDRSSGRIDNLVVHGFAQTGIFATDSWGLDLSRNRIFNCGNGGIRVLAREPGGHDGTMVAHNDIYDMRADAGGAGENGSGIHVLRATGVTVIGNRLKNCAFSAIRLTSASGSVVSANSCFDSGEVAIRAELGASDSVIADNVVDGAAQGIAITNFDAPGGLTTCTGNIVRNIYASARDNPAPMPAGIFAEADTVISDNVIDTVPGVGITAGWGPRLRDVTVSANLVRAADIGVGVSVAEGAGRAVVTGNRVTGAGRAAIAGMALWNIVSDDLVRDAERFPDLTLGPNSAG